MSDDPKDIVIKAMGSAAAATLENVKLLQADIEALRARLSAAEEQYQDASDDRRGAMARERMVRSELAVLRVRLSAAEAVRETARAYTAGVTHALFDALAAWREASLEVRQAVLTDEEQR